MKSATKIADDKQSIIWSRKKNTSNLLSRDNLVKEFEELKKQGMIIGEFDDLIWKVHSTTNHTTLSLTFFKINDFNYTKAMKAYLIFRRKSHISATTLYSEYIIMKQLFIHSSNFTVLTSLVKYLKSLDVHTKLIYMSVMRNSLKFFVIPQNSIAEDIDNYLQANIPIISERQVRDLPQFDDVITFNSVLLDFFKQDISITLDYYPIHIWWKLTNVIPMRPIEFVNLDINCLSVDSYGKKWIEINRFKRKGSTHTTRSVTQRIEITNDIYEVMKIFSNQLERLNITRKKYFFPKISSYSVSIRNHVLKNKTNQNIMLQYHFGYLLHKFHEEVVLAKYDKLLPRELLAGDTRHFAIINMFLQGYNALIIKRMAHHEDMISATHYYDHAKFYVSSYIKRLANSKESEAISKIIGGTIMPFEVRKQFYRYNLKKDEYNEFTQLYNKVPYGFCMNKNAPFENCATDCRLCSPENYLFMPSVNDLDNALEWLSSLHKDLSKKIDNTLELLLSCYNNFKSDMEKLSNPTDNQTRQLSVQLFAQMNQQATLLSRINQITNQTNSKGNFNENNK